MHQKPMAMAPRKNRPAMQNKLYVALYNYDNCIGHIEFNTINNLLQIHDEVKFRINFDSGGGLDCKLYFSDYVMAAPGAGWQRPVLQLDTNWTIPEMRYLIEIAKMIPMILLSYTPGRVFYIQDKPQRRGLFP